MVEVGIYPPCCFQYSRPLQTCVKRNKIDLAQPIFSIASWIYITTQEYVNHASLKQSENQCRDGVVAITTQLHSSKCELRFCAGSNLEIRDVENL